MTFDGGARISGKHVAPLRMGSAGDYFKSGCEQQPSPKARETRPPRGRVFRFLRRDFEGVGQGGRSPRVSQY